MDSAPNLKQDLSMLLDAELKKQLVPGENVLVSLPGSFGEAFVLTDKRAIVIRECEGSGASAKCDTHSYPLHAITGAEATASGMGGFIELKLSEAPPSQDAARVYFPSYDLAKFQAAAAFVTQTVASAATPTAPAASAVIAPTEAAGSSPACPNCGAAVGRDSVFCGQCGQQLAPICEACGSASPAGSKFCRGCGVEMRDGQTDCPKCGARVQRWFTYCTDCGSILRQSCAACGAVVSEHWRHCANCGRQLGSAYIDPRGNVARRIQERLRSAEQTREQPISSAIGGSTPSVQPPAAEPKATAADAADIHNQRGRELFEDGDTEGAIREFRAAIAADPNNASYHCNLAIAYDDNDQDEEALAEYERTLQLDPNDLTALLSLGYMYNENDQPERAEEYWSKILEIAPDSAEAQEVRENLRHQEEL